eukprot:6931443-Pyramimonas_sp.AAC.1
MKAKLWQGAAGHEAGDSLKAEADLLPLQQELRRFESRGQSDLWGLTLCVASGGQWPRQRQADSGYTIDVTCPRCKAAPETLFHRIWQCACNVDHLDFSSTQSLVSQATAQWEADPSLWLRGVPSRDLTCPVFLDPLEAPPLTYYGSSRL